MTTCTLPANPFTGDRGVRIERAVRRAVDHLHLPTVTGVHLALREDPDLSDADYLVFSRMLLLPRAGFDVERWVVSIIDRAVDGGRP